MAGFNCRCFIFLRMESRWPCLQNKRVIRRGVDLSYNIEDKLRGFKREPFSGRLDDNQSQTNQPFRIDNGF